MKDKEETCCICGAKFDMSTHDNSRYIGNDAYCSGCADDRLDYM